MTRFTVLLVLLGLPQVTLAEEAPTLPDPGVSAPSSLPEPEVDGSEPQPELEPPDALSMMPQGLPAPTIEVASADHVPGLAAGHTVDLGIRLDLSESACLSLVAADHASLSMTGPGEIDSERSGDVAVLTISSGRGVLSADALGATIRLGEHLLSVRSGAVAFDLSVQARVWLLGGEGRLDGNPVALSTDDAPPDLSAEGVCLPSRPRVSIALGDPEELLADLERARGEDLDSSEGGVSAESGATCVDSSDSSAASDPNQGMDSGIDPDARRDVGRIRLIVTVPRRSE